MKAKFGKKYFQQLQTVTHGIMGKTYGNAVAQTGGKSRRCFQWVRLVPHAG